MAYHHVLGQARSGDQKRYQDRKSQQRKEHMAAANLRDERREESADGRVSYAHEKPHHRKPTKVFADRHGEEYEGEDQDERLKH